MKNILLIISMLFYSNYIVACCVAGIIEITPRENQLSKNPIILITYDRSYTKIKANKKIKFYLQLENGNKVILKKIETNITHSGSVQLLMKPKKKLKLGQKVKLIVENIKDTTDRSNQTFIKYINSKEWDVTYLKDNEKPIFTNQVSYKYVNHFNSSAPGHGIQGNVKYKDNYSYKCIRGTYKTTETIVEVINEKGENFYIPTIGELFWVFDGTCGAIFEIRRGREEYTYKYKIRLMDMSGNKSKEIQTIEFKTAKI